MTEPRRFTLHAPSFDYRSYFEPALVGHARVVEVVEAAPVEADLERLRRIESAAREALRVLDCDFYLAHQEIRDELRTALGMGR